MVRGFLWSLVVMWPLALLALCHTDLKTRGGRHNEENLNIFFDAVPIMRMQSSALCDDALLFFIYFSQLVHICAHQPVLGSRCLEKRGGVKFIPGIWLGWELLLLFCIQRASCPWLCSRFCCFWPPINRGGLRRIPKRSCCLFASCFSSIYLGSRGVFGLAWSLDTKPKWKPVWCGLLAQGFPLKLAGLLFSLRRIIIFILQLLISCHHTGRCVVFVSFML